MTEITDETVKKIAKLASIQVSEQEIQAVAHKLTHIMNWIEQLNQVNVDGVEPMTCVLPMTLRTRQDQITDGGYPEIIVKNAPLKQDNFFCVPKVVE